MIVLERGPHGPIRWECPDCEGGGEMPDPIAQGTTCCERCDGSGEITVESEAERNRALAAPNTPVPSEREEGKDD